MVPSCASEPPVLVLAPAKANLPAHAGVRPGGRAVDATGVLAALVFVAAFFAPSPLAELLSLGATGSALVFLFLLAAQVLGSRRDQRSGGRIPPHGAIDAGRRTGQLPQLST